MGVYDVVTQQFSEANQYAKEAWNLAVGGLKALAADAKISDLDPAKLDFTFEPVSESVFDSVNPPVSPEVPTSTDSAPVLSGLAAFPTINITVPSNTNNPIEISIPSAPALSFPSDPGEAPDITIPNSPAFSATMPTRPSIVTDFTLPIAPDIIIPAFTGQVPEDNVGEFLSEFNWSEPATYTSQLLALIQNKLADTLTNGGTGIGDRAEQAIWDNAVARQDEQDEKLFNEVLEFFASRGWNIPTGALNAKLTDARIESRRSMEKLNNDILVQQSNLAYQNMKDSISAAIAAESMLIQYANSIAQRSLEAAVQSIQAAVAIYNAKIARFAQKLEAYKASASVYSALVQAQEVIAQIYESQLKAVTVQQSIEMGKLEIYKQDLAAVGLLVDIWKIHLQGNAMILEGEKTKLEAYKTKVEAYVAKMNGESIRANIYTAEVQAEGVKAQINEAYTRAYLANVEAAKTKASIEEIKVSAVSERNKSIVMAFSAEVDAFKAEIQRYSALVDAIVKRYSATTQVFDSEVKKAAAESQNNMATNEANLKLFLSKQELLLKQAEVNLNKALQTNNIRVEAAKAISAVSAQMAAGALSSANAQAHVSGSKTESWDNTKSEPTYSYNHHYTT